jgi:hypothetical protein
MYQPSGIRLSQSVCPRSYLVGIPQEPHRSRKCKLVGTTEQGAERLDYSRQTVGQSPERMAARGHSRRPDQVTSLAWANGGNRRCGLPQPVGSG